MILINDILQPDRLDWDVLLVLVVKQCYSQETITKAWFFILFLYIQGSLEANKQLSSVKWPLIEVKDTSCVIV